jgi:glycosyltransferase involved in cell wall biosynthesis
VKAIVFLKYGTQAASTRYRFLQFQKECGKNGIVLEYSSLLDNDYLRPLFQEGRKNRMAALRGFLKRLKVLLFVHRYDIAIIHCELFPYLPSFFERWVRWRGVPYVYDYDDAIFHQYDRSATLKSIFVKNFLSRKIAHVIHGASAVWAGSEYLAAYARAENPNVQFFPTTIDMDRYLPRPQAQQSGYSKDRPFVIGWIGSPSTSVFVKEIQKPIREFCRKYPAKLVLIGSGPIDLPGIPLEILPWSEETEVPEIQKFDVGIMPLRIHSDWDKGKCAFKLIQYMGCGVPALGSNAGTNRDVIENNVSGFLAGSDDEWFRLLEKIYLDPAAARVVASAGREVIMGKYSMQSLQKAWASSLVQLAKRGR